MPDNFIERLMQPGEHTLGRSGPQGGACETDDPEDTRFIRKPSAVEDEVWGRICAGCKIFDECNNWAETFQASGIYAAGLWRE